ncbi:DUF6723 family protein [Caballeronia sordidicola]|uniref:DUF6723 family protein n=1 Tax=Caballeronia sordidicola TaxID=196367 RepID=UPI000A3CD5C2|nr:DUF6723 family protein [Caballeronia sordidicola]
MKNDPLGPRHTVSEIGRFALPDPLEENFTVQISVNQIAGAYYGQLKVIRRAARRTLFPFEGAPTIGPFDLNTDAREAALLTAHKVIADDVANPER